MSFNKPKNHYLNNKERYNSLININSYPYKFHFNSKKTLNNILSPTKTENNNFEKEDNNIDNIDNIDNSKILQFNNEKYSRNNNLFGKIKKLLYDIQKENNEKNRLFIYKKKGNKKAKSNNNINNKNNNNSNNSKRISTLLVPQKKVYYIMPKVKNQMQLNHYLINDFKEVDSDQAYVGRSLKYQKMNEDLDELVFLNQIKEAEKNGISENIMNDYEKKNSDFLENSPKFGSYDLEFNSNDSNQNHINRHKHKMNDDKKNTIFSNNNYDLSLRRLYTENFKDLPNKAIINGDNNKIKFCENQKNGIINNRSITSRTKNSENENSISDVNDLNKINKSVGIKYLLKIKNKNNLNTINTTKNMEKNHNQNKTEQKQNNKLKIKKEIINSIIDKYSLSNRIYKAQKKEYNKYIKNKQIMRGKNFSKQIAILNKEKEKFIKNENEIEGKGYAKLNLGKLIYQMQLKDIFTNSFNSMRIINEGDQDLDLDNLNKIKQLIKDYEIEMARVMRNSDNPNCIKKRFNKTTVGKFHSSRGIYM